MAEAEPVVLESPAGPPTAPVSTPLEQTIATGDVAAFRAARREARQPQPEPRTPSADSSPAVPAAPASSTEEREAPASEAGSGKGQALQARLGQIEADKARLTQALADRKKLQAELDALGVPRPDAKPPVASSAPAAPTLAQTVANPDVSSPLLTEEQFFAQFPSAPYGQYAVYAGRYAARSEFTQLQQQAARQQAQQAWVQAVAPVREQFPDYDAVVSTAFQDVPDSPTNTAVAGAIERLREPAVLHYLGTHRDVVDALMQLSPDDARLHVAYLAGTLRAQAPPPVPQAKTSTAPRPPTTLGQKAADGSGDALMAAVQADDVAAFRAERLRRKIAATRG